MIEIAAKEFITVPEDNITLKIVPEGMEAFLGQKFLFIPPKNADFYAQSVNLDYSLWKSEPPVFGPHPPPPEERLMDNDEINKAYNEELKERQIAKYEKFPAPPMGLRNWLIRWDSSKTRQRVYVSIAGCPPEMPASWTLVLKT